MSTYRKDSRLLSTTRFQKLLLVVLLCLSGSAYGGEDADRLYAAVDSGDTETVKQLIADGVDVNAPSSRGSCALHAAAVNNNPELIVLLLEHGADPNAQNTQGDTALICATKYAGGNAKTVELLLEAGTNPDVRDKKGNTALDYAKKKEQVEALAVLEAAAK
jgi:ankyrin repeat protein